MRSVERATTTRIEPRTQTQRHTSRCIPAVRAAFNRPHSLEPPPGIHNSTEPPLRQAQRRLNVSDRSRTTDATHWPSYLSEQNGSSGSANAILLRPVFLTVRCESSQAGCESARVWLPLKPRARRPSARRSAPPQPGRKPPPSAPWTSIPSTVFRPC